METKNRLRALFDADANVGLITAELGRVGVAREDIVVATKGQNGSRELASRFSLAHGEPVPGMSGLAPARSRYIARRLQEGAILLSIPMLGEEVVATVHRLGGDFSGTDEIREEDAAHYRTVVPLRSEKPDIQVYSVVDSVVNVHREVVTERVTFSVPVKRESLVIRSVDPETNVAREERIALRHEDVRVAKHTVVEAVVEVRREQTQEIRVVDLDLRHERPIVTGDVQWTRALEQSG